MKDYKEPKVPEIKHSSDLEALLRPFVDAIAFNNAEYEDRRVSYRGVVNMAIQTYGAGARQVYYLQRNPPDTPPDLNRVIKRIKRKYRQAVEDEAARVKAANYRRDYARRKDEACARLIENGWVIGEDFEESNAITFEKHIINEYGILVEKSDANSG